MGRGEKRVLQGDLGNFLGKLAVWLADGTDTSMQRNQNSLDGT